MVQRKSGKRVYGGTRPRVRKDDNLMVQAKKPSTKVARRKAKHEAFIQSVLYYFTLHALTSRTHEHENYHGK